MHGHTALQQAQRTLHCSESRAGCTHAHTHTHTHCCRGLGADSLKTSQHVTEQLRRACAQASAPAARHLLPASDVAAAQKAPLPPRVIFLESHTGHESPQSPSLQVCAPRPMPKGSECTPNAPVEKANKR